MYTSRDNRLVFSFLSTSEILRIGQLAPKIHCYWEYLGYLEIGPISNVKKVRKAGLGTIFHPRE